MLVFVLFLFICYYIIRDYLTNRPQFSMVFFFSLQSFEHFMMSFLWSIGVYTMENVVDLFFTVIVFFFYEKPKTKQPALRDILRHFHGP